MNKHLIISSAGILVSVLIAYYLVAKNEQPEAGRMVTYQEHTPENSSMGDGSQNAQIVDKDAAERAFLEHMLAHHQEAVDTAKYVVERGSDTETKALAERIIVAQEKEIADMKAWYKEWYGVTYTEKDTYQPMMRDLSALSGTELDRAFLEDMIQHHTVAITQAHQVFPAAQHQEILTLAQTIAQTQTSEIVDMRILLKKVPFAAE